MVIGAPISDLITNEAANIWDKLFSAEGFLYWIVRAGTTTSDDEIATWLLVNFFGSLHLFLF